MLICCLSLVLGLLLLSTLIGQALGFSGGNGSFGCEGLVGLCETYQTAFKWSIDDFARGRVTPVLGRKLVAFDA